MIGVIADDLTGAAELAAVGWRFGLRAEVVVGGRLAGRPELVCLTTESRLLSPKAAARRAAQAAHELQAAGAKWIYKKTDSVLRGQVTAEIEAIMAALKLPRTLLLPANPSLGRTIKAGRYFIHGRPIQQTDFARDPAHPRRSANVLRLLAKPTTHCLRALRVGDPLPSAGIFVGEVATGADIQRWITICPAGTLLAGGAETFATALRQHIRARVLRVAEAERMTRGLFVCGSASAACRQFVAQASREGIAVHGLPEDFAAMGRISAPARRELIRCVRESLAGRASVILHPGLPHFSDQRKSRALVKCLAELAAELSPFVRPRRLFAEGGETAAALLHQLNWKRLIVKQELAPGVATLAPIEYPGWQLTIKPGSYVWPDFALPRSR